MPEPIKPRTLGPGVFTIGEADSLLHFDADVTNVKLEPDVKTGDDIDFLDGHTESGEAKISWKISGKIKEDYSEDGAQTFCFKNSGKNMPFTFIPRKNQKMKFTGTLAIVPLGFGGDVKSKNDQDFEFSVQNLVQDFTNPAV